MDKSKTDIWVYSHRLGMQVPKCIGILSAHFGKGRKSFSFEYDKDWISSHEQLLLDPDLGWYSGPQFPNNKDNFGIFLDSMPDSWGKTLMQRREPQRAKEEGREPRILHDIDYLLGVFDESRMGALRFKLDPEGPFLDVASAATAPPIDKHGLALNIVTDNHTLDFDLARSVGEFFMLDRTAMDKILNEVGFVVSDWRKYANSIGIPKTEQDRMAPAFRF